MARLADAATQPCGQYFIVKGIDGSKTEGIDMTGPLSAFSSEFQ